MYKGSKVSVVMPAYNEEDGVYETVIEYKSHPYVDEVIVCNNNSSDRTEERAIAAGAKVVRENRQGYGFACQAALAAASGDLIVLTESDGTFPAAEIDRLFPYVDIFDMVKGARSNHNMVQKGADWTFAMMFANWIVAKYLQVLFYQKSVFEEGSQREAGGTLRVMKREFYEKVRPYFSEGGGAFLPDLTSLVILKGGKVLELPICYKERFGISKGTGNRINAAKIAFKMMYIITRNRIKGWLGYYGK